MKRFFALFLVAALFCALLGGCSLKKTRVNFMGGIGREDVQLPATDFATDPVETTEAQTIACEDIYLDVKRIVFSEAGESRMLYVDAYPENTTDEIFFESSDEGIVTVSKKGDASAKVTAIAPGEAEITVRSGEVTHTCAVECAFEIENTDETADEDEKPTESIEEVLRLNRVDFTLAFKGESWVLYNGKIPPTSITWTSSDESICTVENGKVVAVGDGVATVTAEYNGQKATCRVYCNFRNSGNGVAGNGGVSADGEG